MPKIVHSRLFQAGLGILLIFLIILVGRQISFIFQPLVVIFNTLFFPFLISGFLFFLIDPVVDWLEEYRLPRWVSILLLYVLIALMLYFLFTTMGAALFREVERLIRDIPRQMEQAQHLIATLQENPFVSHLLTQEPQLIDKYADQLTDYLERLITSMAGGAGRLFGSAAEAFLVMVAIPFILFYMLKDGRRWPRALLQAVPERHRSEASTVMMDVKWGVSAYIQGIVLICLSVGVLVYVGYRIIGLDYPLLLAFFSMITNVIPFLGPIIGSIPAVIIGIIHSPLMALKVIAVIVVVQQVESLLISPQVMSRKLAIGPLTVLLLVLVSGRMAGLIGMILALPTFVILKITVQHILIYLRSNYFFTP